MIKIVLALAFALPAAAIAQQGGYTQPPPTAPSSSDGFKVNPPSTSSNSGSTSVTNSVSYPVGGGVSAVGTASSVYTQPGRGADGPVPGSQRGSSESSTIGIGVQIDTK